MEDLYSDNDHIRGEARTFFLGGGEWKKSREAWLDMVGLDPEAAVERLGELLAEKPSVAFLCRGLTPDGSLDTMPEGQFLASELEGDAALAMGKLRLLVKAGHITQVRRGVYEVAPKSVSSLPKHDLAA